MVHTTMALSWASRITSYSISLKPAILRSMRHWCTGLIFSPASAIRRSSCLLCAKPPPVPPSVYAGRTTTGYPSSLAYFSASSTVWTISLSGTGSPSSFISERKSSRSSALLIASRSVPSISTPNSSSTPSLWRATTRFRPVCPPSVPRMASGLSLYITRLRNSVVSGSIYTLSAIDVSVIIVAGFELTRTTSYPSSRSDWHAWDPE